VKKQPKQPKSPLVQLPVDDLKQISGGKPPVEADRK
jgi:hypothetical protein